MHKKSASTYPILAFFICLFLLCTPIEVKAQLIPGTSSGETAQEPSEPEWPVDSLGRRTPRGTVAGFIKAVGNQNYDRAQQFLNTEEAPINEAEGARLARVLQRLLDQGGKIMPYSWISDDPGGRIDDDLPPNLEKVGSVIVNGETVDLTVEEIKTSEGAPLWLFSSATVERLANVTGVGGATLIERFLPTFLLDNQWWGVPIGHWLVLIALIALAYLIAWALIWILLFLIRKTWRKAATEPTAGIMKALALPVRIFATVLLFVALSQEIGISIVIRQRFSEITVIVGVVALLILLWRLNDFISNYTQNRMTLREQFSAVSVILFLRRITKLIIIFVGAIAILGAFGVDVTAGLAALGIGGLAIALGAQKSMENFVGGVTLIADRPIRIGDFCKVGETIGTVEQIGMRSTRIRTLDRTLVTIPNGELSSVRIENYAPRDRFRFAPTFNFRYETTADQMRYLLVELRRVLYSHPKVDPEPARVRFAGFGNSSLDVEVFSYINATDFNDFVEIREDILLRMMDVVAKSGTGFAFPSQTLYLTRDEGLSKEKSEKAEETVRNWKEKEEMEIPKFHPDSIEKLKDTLQYPPEGASIRSKSEQD